MKQWTKKHAAIAAPSCVCLWNIRSKNCPKFLPTYSQIFMTRAVPSFVETLYFLECLSCYGSSVKELEWVISIFMYSCSTVAAFDKNSLHILTSFKNIDEYIFTHVCVWPVSWSERPSSSSWMLLCMLVLKFIFSTLHISLLLFKRMWRWGNHCVLSFQQKQWIQSSFTVRAWIKWRVQLQKQVKYGCSFSFCVAAFLTTRDLIYQSVPGFLTNDVKGNKI